MKFFDEYNRFYSTSLTSPYPYRLNGRYEAIIKRNIESFKDVNVLDIASHDGRWSFAALKAGAKHVTGIEPRKELIVNAVETFTHYGVESKFYDFICGDVFDKLHGKKFDVVMCLGFYYHTLRHAELLDLIERTGAKLVIIDTEVTPPVPFAKMDDNDKRQVFKNPFSVQLLQDEVDDQQMAFQDSLTRNGRTLVGRPSRKAIEYMANHFGYSYTCFNWLSYFELAPEHSEMMQDYSEDWRGTFFLTRG